MDRQLGESSEYKNMRDGTRERRRRRRREMYRMLGESSGSESSMLGESSGYKNKRDGDTERREREMDRKLYEAAITGHLILLDKPLRERIASLGTAEEKPLHIAPWFGRTDCVEDNPLHIASWFGRTDFVKEVLSLNQSLTGGLNSDGLSPLHLASLKGHVEVAKVLIESDPAVCFFRDKKGRTPFHIAAEKSQLAVLGVLVEAEPRAAWMMTGGGDPLLHMCINHNQFYALYHLLNLLLIKVGEKELLDEFMNLKDDDGNTILHLLASKGQHQVIGDLYDIFFRRLHFDVNAVNIHHLIALDISMQHSIDDWLKVKRILLKEGARTAKDLRKDQPTAVYQKRIKNLRLEKYLKWVSKTRETLMVVAILMATVTFQAGMSPPGGVWQSDDPNNKDIRAGESIMSCIDPRRYISFIIFNSLGFVASLGLIVVLVGRFSINDKVALWTTMVWISVISILLIYTFSLSFLTSKNVGASWSPISYGWGLPLIGVLLLVRFPRPVTWLFDRLGKAERNFRELWQEWESRG